MFASSAAVRPASRSPLKAGSNCRVVLAEGGGTKETEEARSLYRGIVANGSSHEPLEEGRRRQWGGTTAAWGGTCLPFDEIDFEKRDWVPHSGWPFSKATLHPYYQRAQRLCEVGDYLYQAEQAFPDRQREMIAGFDGEAVVTNRIERWSPPTHFGRRYEKQLRESTNVTVLLHANCTHVQLDAGTNLVGHVEAASFKGNGFRIKARYHVIATEVLNPRGC